MKKKYLNKVLILLILFLVFCSICNSSNAGWRGNRFYDRPDHYLVNCKKIINNIAYQFDYRGYASKYTGVTNIKLTNGQTVRRYFLYGLLGTGKAPDGNVYVSGKLLTGRYSRDGKYYKNGRVYTGWVNLQSGGRKYYIQGTLADNIVYNGKYYKNGEYGTGVFNGRYYKKGLPSSGVVNGIRYSSTGYKLTKTTYNGRFYIDGKPFTGLYNGTLYKNGKRPSGYCRYKNKYYLNGYILNKAWYRSKYYVLGVEANGTYGGIYYKDGQKFNGTKDGKRYVNGKVLNRQTYNGSYYVDGVAIVKNGIMDIPYISQRNSKYSSYRFKYHPIAITSEGKKVTATIKNNACGIACTTMVLRYLTRNNSIQLETVADWADRNNYFNGTGSEGTIFAAAAKKWGVSGVTTTTDMATVQTALKARKPVVSLQSKGIFTKEQHYIVLIGMDSQGKVHVHNPNNQNIQGNNVAYNFNSDVDATNIRYYIFEYGARL